MTKWQFGVNGGKFVVFDYKELFQWNRTKRHSKYYLLMEVG